jgi:hypothetical protein
MELRAMDLDVPGEARTQRDYSDTALRRGLQRAYDAPPEAEHLGEVSDPVRKANTSSNRIREWIATAIVRSDSNFRNKKIHGEEEVERRKQQELASPLPVPTEPKPQQNDSVLAQMDQQPREIPRSPGVICTVDNTDGALPYFTRGKNIVMVHGFGIPAKKTEQKLISDDIIHQHQAICGDHALPVSDIGRHKEGCPFQFHKENCREVHHYECPIGRSETTVEDPGSSVTAPHGATHAYVKGYRLENDGELKIRGIRRHEYDKNRQWVPIGMRDQTIGREVPLDRCIPLSGPALTSFLEKGSEIFTGKPRDYFDLRDSKWERQLGIKQGGGTTKLKTKKWYSNPFGSKAVRGEDPQIQSLVGSDAGTEHIYRTLAKQLKEGRPGEIIDPWANWTNVRNQEETRSRSSEPTIDLSDFDDVKPKKTSYVRPDETEKIEKEPPCRFCDDPANINGKGSISRTGTSPDGRPLFAHAECQSLVAPRQFNSARINQMVGLQEHDDTGHEIYESTDTEKHPGETTQVTNLNLNGTAIPPR